MRKHSVEIITLGCSKNLVDSQRLINKIEQKGYQCSHDSSKPNAEIVVVNTCGFIGDAKEESINTILELAREKERGRIKKLYVMGCLSERYGKELKHEIPEVDKFFGKFNYNLLLNELQEVNTTHKSRSLRLTPHHYSYIKISEGCDQNCAYCAIPLITGNHKSRIFEDILTEVESLVGQGVKEFQIIAQELTYYGVDLYGRQAIAELIDRMAKIKGVKWIRLHYAYPTDFPLELLDVIKNNDNVCKYLDIAFQHISDNVLKRMKRKFSKKETYDLIENIRKEVPNITLRTTLMVGFPGETDKDFQELIDFVKWARFERMGAFMYSEEEGTYSQRYYKDDVSDDIKQARLDKLMAIQQDISLELQSKKIGNKYRVIIDRKEGEYYIGRTEDSSPDVDPEILIPANNRNLKNGRFYNVEIVDAEEFDLYGKVI